MTNIHEVTRRKLNAAETEIEQLRAALIRILELDAECRIALPPRDLALLQSLVTDNEAAVADDTEARDEG